MGYILLDVTWSIMTSVAASCCGLKMTEVECSPGDQKTIGRIRDKSTIIALIYAQCVVSCRVTRLGLFLWAVQERRVVAHGVRELPDLIAHFPHPAMLYLKSNQNEVKSKPDKPITESKPQTS